MENIIHVTLSVYKNEDISESKEYIWSGMYGDASPTPIAVNKKIKIIFFSPLPKQVEDKAIASRVELS